MKFSTLSLAAISLVVVGAEAGITYCFGSTESNNCEGHDFGKCVQIMTNQYKSSCPIDKPTQQPACFNQAALSANKYCGFWCAEIKNKDQCESVKKQTGYGASCENSSFC